MSKEKKQEAHRVTEARGFNRLAAFVNRVCRGAMSNIRLSLSFRIALHYAAQLARTWLRAVLLMTLALLLLGLGMAQREARLAVQGKAYDRRTTTVRTDEAVTDNSDVIRLSLRETWQDAPFERVTVAVRQDRAVWLVRVPAQGAWLTWVVVIAALTLVDLRRMLYFVVHNRRLDKRVLAPIREMTAQAEAFSAANLSDRLNIAGTKNELRDLAAVINRMLDRIELSYNSQKQFVSDASHELRTPIAVIQGYADMMRRWGKDDKEVLDESVDAISQEAANMKELVDNLLFLARHDKKSLMMEMERCDVAELTREVARETAMVTPADTIEAHAETPCEVICDRGLVKQVLRILTDNAVKYTPEGGHILLTAERTAAGCTLSVQDNGSGIAPEELPKIFERFYRSDEARKQVNSGHGLGLSIARIIVMAHRGSIQVRSKPGEGTVFRVLLPDNPSAAAAGAEQETEDKRRSRRKQM